MEVTLKQFSGILRKFILLKMSSMIKKIKNAPGWLGLSEDRTEFIYLPDRAEIVEYIFQLSIAGLGGYTIAKLLNKKEVPAFGTSKKWDQSTIYNMLSSRATIGEYQKKRVFEGKEVPVGEPIPNYYPAVIDKQIFEAAQTARRDNLSMRRGRRASRSQTFLRKFRDALTAVAKSVTQCAGEKAWSAKEFGTGIPVLDLNGRMMI